MTSHQPPEQVGSHVVGQSESDESYQRFRREDRSLGEIVSEVMDNASTLVKQEVELAKAEAKVAAGRAGKGIGMFVGAAVGALMALVALTLCLWWAIGVLIGTETSPALGWSGLIVTIIWLAVAGILAAVGKSELDKIKGLPKTQDTITKIPNAATGHEEKNR
ncbi:MAG: phage holin family protein [Propionibacteriaceae bacterium]|nr:phage holin family protein [Propionibacteriaceae bacterium]